MKLSGVLGIIKQKRAMADKAKTENEIKQEEQAQKHNVTTILDAEAAEVRRQELAEKK